MAKILSVCNRLQAGDYENGNWGKRRVSLLTQFIHAALQFKTSFHAKFYRPDVLPDTNQQKHIRLQKTSVSIKTPEG